MATSTIPQKTATGGAITSATSGVDVGGRWVYDPNTKTVRIYMYAHSSSNITTDTILANIPSRYRPSSNYALFGLIKTTGDTRGYYGRIETNGNITQQLGTIVRDLCLFGEYSVA